MQFINSFNMNVPAANTDSSEESDFIPQKRQKLSGASASNLEKEQILPFCELCV